MTKDLIKRIIKYGYGLITFPIVKLVYYKRIPQIENDLSTLKIIEEYHVSVSRFGDGELNLIEGKGNHFTMYNNALAERLKEVLMSDEKNHIVCIPPQLKRLSEYRFSQKLFWSTHLTWKLKSWIKYLIPGKKYYSSFISRFYLCYLNPDYSKKVVNSWKQIWENRDIILVEGEFTRLGVGNDLFDNAKSIKRIICPHENAFGKYNDILRESKKYANSIILIALGQTATVLAYDLSKYNCWAIDVGHIDIEYEWFLRGVRERMPISNKYTNEVQDGANCISICEDETYRSQIICKIV